MNRLFLFFLLATSLQFLYTGCSNTEQSVPNEDLLNKIPYIDRLPEIQYKIINESYFVQEIVSNGKINAVQKADLRFSLNEPITQILVKNGQWVSKGTVLARLDNSRLRIDLIDARQSLEESMINFKDELIGYSKTFRDTAQMNDEMLVSLKIRSGLLRAENQLVKVKSMMNETVLRAPFTGIVANLNVKEFNLPPADKPFCTLVNLEGLDVEFSVLETELQWIGSGKKVRIIPYSHDTTIYEGKITEINPLVDDSGMIALTARISNPSRKLLDGMHVKVIVENNVPEQLVVPKEAVVLRDNREVIFTYKQEESTVYWNYVKLGLENTNSFIVTDGLNPGDSVVVVGNMNLAHMTRVRVGELND